MNRDDVTKGLVITVTGVDNLRDLVRGFGLAEPSVDAKRLPGAGGGIGDLHRRAVPRRRAKEAAGVVMSDADALDFTDVFGLEVEDILGAAFKIIHRVVQRQLAAVALVTKDDERDVGVAPTAAEIRGDHLNDVVVDRRVAGSGWLKSDPQVFVIKPVVMMEENLLAVAKVGDRHHVEVPRRSHALTVNADV